VDVDGGTGVVIDLVDPREIDRAEYIAALNRCFPGWGGDAMFDWCFQRAVAGCVPDLLVVRDDGRVVAGAGVVYRTVRAASDTVPVGVICAAWTDPDARGRGLFSDLMEAARLQVRRRDGVALLGFVRAVNVSARRLFAMGWTMVPARYLRHVGRASARPGGLKPALRSADFARHATHFVYTDDEWLGQFIDRPKPAQCVAGEGWRAIVEGNRLLDLTGDRERALNDLGDFSAYSTTNEDWPGCESRAGYLGVIGDLPSSEWDVRNGDRM
jgi:GNAT superfamily N-acetyltransferase